MSTYSTDADILAYLPGAERLLWVDEDTGTRETSFERIRTVAYNEINAALKRRTPSILPGDLSDPTMLKSAEVYLALYHLNSTARVTGSDGDYFRKEALRYRDLYLSEINGPIPTGDGSHTIRRIRIRRG